MWSFFLMPIARRPLRTAAPIEPQTVEAWIGRRIRTRRAELGWSQAALASRLGLVHQQVQRYEAGKGAIRASCLIKIAAALGVGIGYFSTESHSVAADGETPPPALRAANGAPPSPLAPHYCPGTEAANP
jgi:ribosome-binding protein aMBF1 (putative translation factor)